MKYSSGHRGWGEKTEEYDGRASSGSAIVSPRTLCWNIVRSDASESVVFYKGAIMAFHLCLHPSHLEIQDMLN